MFLSTIPTVALGWRYSPYKHGTTQDADFWFLTQTSCITILSLATISIPICGNKILPTSTRCWIWVLSISASLCAVLAPLVYVFGLTEWSQFMSIVAGIVQAFLTLHIALVADSNEVSMQNTKDK